MKVSDKKKRALVGLMFKSVSKHTWLTVKRQQNERIGRLLIKLEAIIATHGHYVQFVSDGENSFIYTAGRNDKNKPDFVVGKRQASRAIATLVNEVADRYDSENLNLDVEYESEILVTATEPSQPTKYKLMEVDIDFWRSKTLGVFKRYRGEGAPKLLQIVVADRYNNF